MNIKYLFGSCLVASFLAVVGCGSDGAPGAPGTSQSGTAGADGQNGAAGATGPGGAAGAGGAAGTSGSNGADGLPGAAGAGGAAGAAGAVGQPGEVGPGGAQGDSGTPGDLLCGDTLIPASEWHTVCGSSVGACKTGQVQCRASLGPVTEGSQELVLSRVCYGEVAAAANSGKCNLDTDCDGVLDDTTGAGSNVTLVRQSVQLECFVSGSSCSCDHTLVGGVCRNAAKHCLLPSDNLCQADANGEGVLWSDFVAADHESDMGFECVDGSTVRTWECTVTGGVASVTCTGPRGL